MKSAFALQCGNNLGEISQWISHTRESFADVVDETIANYALKRATLAHDIHDLRSAIPRRDLVELTGLDYAEDRGIRSSPFGVAVDDIKKDIAEKGSAVHTAVNCDFSVQLFRC